MRVFFVHIFVSDDNFGSEELIVFMLHICINHHSRKTDIDFGFKTSMDKVIDGRELTSVHNFVSG